MCGYIARHPTDSQATEFVSGLDADECCNAYLDSFSSIESPQPLENACPSTKTFSWNAATMECKSVEDLFDLD